MGWYYMKMTQDMKDNPEPYYNRMVKIIDDNSGLTFKSFKGVLDRNYRPNIDRVVATKSGYDLFYHGGTEFHVNRRQDIEIKYITKNLIGGKLL